VKARQLFAVSLVAGAVAGGAAWADGLPPIDAAQILNEPLRYVLIHHGKEAGEMFYAAEKRDDIYVVHDGTTLFPNIRESVTISFDAGTYAPRSLNMDADFNRSILEAQLVWADGHVKGEYRRKRPDELSKTVIPLDAEAPDGSILRGAIFALLPGMPMEVGAEYAFKWFTSMSGSFDDVKVQVGDIETVETLGGSFETYKVTIDAKPRNIAYVTTSAPRKIVRIDVVGQDMRFELPAAESEAEKD
jgi:hypothetical protein